MAGPRKLTPKQARFVQEYPIDLNAAQAAIRAGYSAKTARVIGHENLTKPNIAAAIEKAKEVRAQRTRLTSDMVVDELRKIAFANMADYMKSTPEGDPCLDFSRLTREQTAALAEVTVEHFLDHRGEKARSVRRVKFKLHDKRAALVDLGRHLGIFVHKPDHGQIEVATNLHELVIARIERIANSRRVRESKEADAAAEAAQRRVRESKEADATAEAEAEAAHLLKARAAAAEAGRPKSEPAPGSMEYQALHPEWRPEED